MASSLDSFQLAAENSYSSDSDYSGDLECLDLSYVMLHTSTLSQHLDVVASEGVEGKKKAADYECMLLNNNLLTNLPDTLASFHNLRILDVSSNNLTHLPDAVLHLNNLTSLVVKNNQISDAGVPKIGQCSSLKEVNFSGNVLSRFPPQFLELEKLKFLYVGGNRINELPREIFKLKK